MPHIKGNPVKKAPDLELRGLELLDKIIEIIEEHPEHWDQRNWATVTDVPGVVWSLDSEQEWNLERDGDSVPETCGTAMCVAGWAAHLCGAQLQYRATGDGRLGANYAMMSGEGTPLISIVARQLLGLSYAESEELFNEMNSLNDIRELRDEIADRIQEN